MKLTCDNCGEDLKFRELDLTKEEVIVEPCETCLEQANSRGYDTGIEAGSDEEYQDGYDEGYKVGFEEGKEEAKG